MQQLPIDPPTTSHDMVRPQLFKGSFILLRLRLELAPHRRTSVAFESYALSAFSICNQVALHRIL